MIWYEPEFILNTDVIQVKIFLCKTIKEGDDAQTTLATIAAIFVMGISKQLHWFILLVRVTLIYQSRTALHRADWNTTVLHWFPQNKKFAGDTNFAPSLKGKMRIVFQGNFTRSSLFILEIKSLNLLLCPLDHFGDCLIIASKFAKCSRTTLEEMIKTSTDRILLT